MASIDAHPSPWLDPSVLIPDIVTEYVKLKALFIKTCKAGDDPDLKTLAGYCCDLIAVSLSEKKRHFIGKLKACSCIDDIATILFFDLSKWMSFDFLERVVDLCQPALQKVREELEEYKYKLRQILTTKLSAISDLQRKHPERCDGLDSLIELVLEHDLDSDGVSVQDLICEQYFLAERLSIPRNLLQVFSRSHKSVVFILHTLKMFESQMLNSIKEKCRMLYRQSPASKTRVGANFTFHTLSVPARPVSQPLFTATLPSSDSGQCAGTEMEGTSGEEGAGTHLDAGLLHGSRFQQGHSKKASNFDIEKTASLEPTMTATVAIESEERAIESEERAILESVERATRQAETTATQSLEAERTTTPVTVAEKMATLEAEETATLESEMTAYSESQKTVTITRNKILLDNIECISQQHGAHHLELSCFSCKEHVDQLSCLPCLHSLGVCQTKECRQKLTECGAFCQHCKERFNEPAEGFPRYAFAERKAAAKKMKEEGTFCCGEHDTPQVAVVFCSDCPGLLCEECHNAHRMVAVLKEHRIVSLEDAMKAGLAVPGHPLLCPAHKEELLYFCQDCEVLICIVCRLVGPHQPHSAHVLFVGEEVGQQNRQPLEQCISFAKNRIEETSSAVGDVDSRLLTLREESNRCKENIADLKDHMIEAVNRRCAVLVAEVKEAEEKRRRELEQYKETLEAHNKMVDLFHTSAAEIVQEGTTKEQLSLRQTVIQRASSLSVPPPQAPPSSSSVFLVPEKKEEAEKILLVMGRVSLGPAPEASSMEGLSIVDNTVECRPWSLPLNIRVMSRDSRGVECVGGGERVESVLTPTSCGVPVQGEVEDRADGTYQVTFRCLPSEECRLSVTVNGSDIRGSPVRVTQQSQHHQTGDQGSRREMFLLRPETC